MKNFISFLIVALLVVTPLQVKSQDTTRINVYAGIVGSGFVQTDSASITKWANLRVGIHYKEKITKIISFDGRIGFDPGENSVIFFSALKADWKNFGISAGYQPTPASEIRPSPLSVDAQFLFAAEAIPPGGSLGTTFYYKNVKAGIYLRNKKAEYQLAYNYKFFTIGVWTNTADTIKKFLGGATIKIKLPYLYAMASVTADKRQALALSIRPIKKINYNLVWDIAYKDQKVCNNLVGIMHAVKIKKLTDARYGIGYDFITKSVGVFFLVGFNYKE